MSKINITLTIDSIAALTGLSEALDLYIELESERAKESTRSGDKADKVDTKVLDAVKTLRKEIR